MSTIGPLQNYTQVSPTLAIYCNRTLNMRSIRAIGYDMDYTLIHYRVEEWERRAYQYIKDSFVHRGWPIEHLQFEPERVVRGLIVDRDKGNLVKANRFGFIKRSMHGTRELDFEEQRALYSRTIVDLGDSRWYCLNTLFSLSEACMYAQLVDLLDEGRAPKSAGILGYVELFDLVRTTIDYAHMEGKLKADILSDPDRYVLRDKETVYALLDQKASGKKVLLITNSEWNYTHEMMTYCFDPFLPTLAGKKLKWRDLFDVIIVGARKPLFFSGKNALFEVVTDDGLLKPLTRSMELGRAYLGGSAADVEKFLGVSGDEILYVGDHMFGDVLASKSVLRWRTALVLRELENEILAAQNFLRHEQELELLMAEKETLESQVCLCKVKIQRIKAGYAVDFSETENELLDQIDKARLQIADLDERLTPLARNAGQLSNRYWGLLMRTGNDKSLLAYQVERYADIYTSRVSNFMYATPTVFFRSLRGNLPHDRFPRG